MFLVQKYTEYKAAQAEHQKKKVTEKELSTLNHKIDKLLLKLEEHEPEMAHNQDEECVVCVSNKATMVTYPCAHRVVCRKCFVKTIQMAVTQRLLPLRCVICRSKILRLQHGPSSPNGSSNVSQSASLYSVASNTSTTSGTSWKSTSTANTTSASIKTESFPTFRRAQMAWLGYQPLRSMSPPPPVLQFKSNSNPSTPSQQSHPIKRKILPAKELLEPPTTMSSLRGKAQLSQDFQREFRKGIQSCNNTRTGMARVRCCRQMSLGNDLRTEAWKNTNEKRSSPPPSSSLTQGRRSSGVHYGIDPRHSAENKT